MLKLFGIFSAIVLGISPLMQAIASFKSKSSKGLDSKFLITWGVGMLGLLIYVVFTSKDIILIGDYTFNLSCLSVICYYKFRG